MPLLSSLFALPGLKGRCTRPSASVLKWKAGRTVGEVDPPKAPARAALAGIVGMSAGVLLRLYPNHNYGVFDRHLIASDPDVQIRFPAVRIDALVLATARDLHRDILIVDVLVRAILIVLDRDRI